MPGKATPPATPTRMDSGDARLLRQRAERHLPPHEPGTGEPAAEGNLRAERMLHELQVHELELAMQNEDLRTARADEAELLRCFVELFDHAPVGYITLNEAGLIEQVNQRGAALLGASPQLLAGVPLAGLVAPADRTALLATLKSAGSQPGVAQCEVRVGDEAGATLQVEARGEPGRGSLLVALEDISARKRADLAERDLLVLRESARLHAALLSRFSHELRTPLHAINGFSELLLDSTDPAPTPEQRQMLRHILQAGQHLLTLVDVVLDPGPKPARGG